jgi:S-DNA-T family DNA segregation ATPase FtsK/SpoIIIE
LLAVGAIAVLLLLPGLLPGTAGAPLRGLFGWGAYALAAGLLATGAWLTFRPTRVTRIPWEGLVLCEILLLALLIWSHAGLRDPLSGAWAGRGGGLGGWAGSVLLVDLFGVTGTQVMAALAVAAALAGLLYMLRARVKAGRVAWPVLPATGWTLPLSGAALAAALARLRQRPSDGATPAPAGPRGVVVLAGAQAATRGASGKPATSTPGSKRSASPRPRPARLPPLDLLAPAQVGPNGDADARQRAQTLKDTLAEFGVPVEVVSIKEGPTVTQFGLEPGEVVRELRNGEVQRRRVTVHSILRLSDDLALALAAASIRIEAPVPGRPYVGVEIPNTAKTLVNLRGILEAREFAKVGSPLALAIGRDVSGDPVVVDLERMPHLLIAGATGSGKSVCINALVCSLLMNNGPERVKFVMVDPKMVELPAYNSAPHLLGQVITDVTQVPGALSWLTVQMDERYRLFSEAGVRNVSQYNRKLGRGRQSEGLPYLILVIDEMADLMMNVGLDVERQICRLAQMARATGIHLIIATQRPSVDVITGLIKANFPARVAFAVTTQIDSRVILDGPGAERLLGRGDMLLMTPDSAKLARIQGCWVSDREIEAIVAFWQATREPEEAALATVAPWVGMGLDDPGDQLLQKAIRLIGNRDHISTSMLQRQLRIGFPRAARLMEQLEEMGYVGSDEGGGRSRQVLVGRGELQP